MMSDLAATAMRWRQVREAQDLFLDLWALEEIAARARLLDRVVEDLNTTGMNGFPGDTAARNRLRNTTESYCESVHRRRFIDD